MFQGIFKSAINDANKNYIFGTGSIPIQIKTAQLDTFADGTTKQQGYQVAEVNKLISTMLTGWDANGNKPKSMSDNYLELILSSDNGFVIKKRLQFPHIIAWQNDTTPYNIADVYKEFSLDNWLKADDFENPDITLVVEPTDEILTTSTANPPEVTTTNSGRFYLYYRNLPVGVNRIHIDFHIKTKTEPIDFDLEVIDGLSWKDAQTILSSNEQAKINVLLSGVKDVYKFTGAEGNFEEITMHEWRALYQQIISLNPSNKFTHDLFFVLIEEFTYSDMIADGTVTSEKIANNAITSEKIVNNAVSIEQVSFKDEIVSANRCNPSACVHGYIDRYTGELVTNINTRYASDFIPVSTKGLYCYGVSGYGIVGGNAVYDAAKNFLREFIDNVYEYQDGDAYVRWTLSTNSVEKPSVYIIEGTSAGSYTPFVPTKFIIKSEYLPKEYLPALSLCGKDSIVASSDTIVAGTSLQITNFPQYLKGNGIVSFSGKLTSFDEMSVGFGTSTNSIAVKVDATNVYIIKNGNQLGGLEIAHGLNISDFINITFERDLVTPKVVVSTISGLFVHTMSPFENIEFYGLPIATMGAGTVVTNAILRATSNRFNKPIWVCGDSYVSLYGERWTKQMINTIGEDNFLLIGLAGGTSSQIYSDLTKALALGTPKFLTWCLGMNDSYAKWLETFESLKTLCSQNGIELILQTIPIPNLSTSSNQKQINTAIKASGYRYVDAALAMSPNSSYPWYDGFANKDGVHTTILGAKILASRFLSDFPEFMQ